MKILNIADSINAYEDYHVEYLSNNKDFLPDTAHDITLIIMSRKTNQVISIVAPTVSYKKTLSRILASTVNKFIIQQKMLNCLNMLVTPIYKGGNKTNAGNY